MNVGDMTYTFIDLDGVQQSIEIPNDIIRQARKDGIANKDAIMRYAADQGFKVKVPNLVKSTSSVKRKNTRKPNDQKRALIQAINETFSQFGNVNVINEERQIQVVIDGIIFEATLVQKRSKK